LLFYADIDIYLVFYSLNMRNFYTHTLK